MTESDGEWQCNIGEALLEDQQILTRVYCARGGGHWGGRGADVRQRVAQRQSSGGVGQPEPRAEH